LFPGRQHGGVLPARITVRSTDLLSAEPGHSCTSGKESTPRASGNRTPKNGEFKLQFARRTRDVGLFARHSFDTPAEFGYPVSSDLDRASLNGVRLGARFADVSTVEGRPEAGQPRRRVGFEVAKDFGYDFFIPGGSELTQPLREDPPGSSRSLLQTA
jgi:hypothetical protein